MLPNEAHVSLVVNGVTTDFLLDESYDTIYRKHYHHVITPLVVGSDVVIGSKGERATRPDRLFWTYEDWQGGEGPPNYDLQNPNVYYVSSGGVNPRYKNQLHAAPSGTDVAFNQLATPPKMVVAGGNVWAATGGLTFYSTDGVTWSSGPTLDPGYSFTAIAGSEDYLWLAAFSGTTRRIYRCTTSTATSVITETSTRPHLGLAYWIDGKVYGWTARRLFSYDVNNSFELTASQYRKVFDNGFDLASGATYYADMSGETGLLFFMTATIGSTRVWQRTGSGKTTMIWRPGGIGFTGRTLAIHNGNLVVGGHYGGSSANTGRGTAFVLDLSTHQPFDAAFIRRDSENSHVVAVAPSFGPQILLGTDNREVFVYDFTTDGLSELGAMTLGNTLSDVITFREKRIAAWQSNTTAGITYYKDDDPANRGGTLNPLDTPNYDFSLPFDTKELVGFHVSFVPLNANQTLTISYQLDDSGSFTALTNITSATPGNATGRVFQQVSTPSSVANFYKMKFRIQGTTSSGLSPIVHAVTAEAKTLAYEETWELAIRLRDETPQNSPSDRQQKAEQVRDVLVAAVKAKTVVTLKDGYGYRGPYKEADGTAGYITTTCTIEGIDDRITKESEGTMIVSLKAVPV